MQFRAFGSYLFAAVHLAAGTSSAQPTAGQIIAASGIDAGLCVYAGATDGAALADLTNGGRMLVHGLTLDESVCAQMRAAIAAKSAYGVASAERLMDFTRLPYAMNLVNLLVVDADALGANPPPNAEIDRVLAPFGVSYVKSRGSWTKTAKQKPQGMDDWPQMYYGPEGNPVSHDTEVRLSTSLQWIGWYGKSSGFGLHGPSRQGVRVGSGKIYYQNYFDAAGTRKYVMDMRDAFNGIPYWQKEAGNSFAGPAIIDDNKLYTVTHPRDTLKAYDAATGVVVRTYTAGSHGKGNDAAPLQNVLYRGSFVQLVNDTAFCFNESDGSLKWTWSAPGRYLLFPAIDTDRNRIVVAVCSTTVRAGRWPQAFCAGVVSLNLADGSQAWFTNSFLGLGGGPSPHPVLGQLVYHKGKIVAHSNRGGVGNQDPFMAAFDAADGQMLWFTDYQNCAPHCDTQRVIDRNYYFYWPHISRTDPAIRKSWIAAVRDTLIYLVASGESYEFSINTGKHVRGQWDDFNVVNQRCSRPRMTDNYMLTGFLAMVDNRSRSWSYQNIARSGCATGVTPAYGMIYNGPNGQCGCFVQLRGCMAFSPESTVELYDESQRTRSFGAPPAGASATSWANQATGTQTIAVRTPALAGSPVRNEWQNNDELPYPETSPVAANGRTYVAVVNEHRLECREGSKVLWSFTAAGRISTPPVVSNGMVFFGAHDGYAYALREEDGAPVWRFLAGRNDRRIVAYGQVESSYPVYGVVLHDNNICLSAGRHPELDGGILLWGLRPKDGTVAWKTVVYTPPATYGARGKDRYVSKVLNEAPTSSGSGVCIAGICVDPGDPGNPIPTALQSFTRAILAEPSISVSGPELLISFPTAVPLEGTIRMIDTRGRKVFGRRGPLGGHMSIHLGGVSAGRYYVQVLHGEGALATRAVVLK